MFTVDDAGQFIDRSCPNCGQSALAPLTTHCHAKQEWRALGYSGQTWAEANPEHMEQLQSDTVKAYSRDVAEESERKALNRLYWGPAWG